MVKEQLDSDVRLGVIEMVTEPSAWCHRMVVVSKPDGTPRRTVDLQPLNKWCDRAEWVTDPPAKMARRVTRGAWKTVTDAWNGSRTPAFMRFKRDFAAAADAGHCARVL